MYQQERNANGSNVMCAANFENVSESHDRRIPSSYVSRSYIIIHTKVKRNMNFRKIWMACYVEFPYRIT